MDAAQLQQVIETVLNGIIGAPGNNAALQAIVNQQVQQAVLNQNQGQGQQQVPGQPAAAPFRLIPGGTSDDSWNFERPNDLKIYIMAGAPIEPPFAGEEEVLNAFLRKILLRAQSFGFSSVLMILDTSGVPRNITKEFGCLTLANVQAAAVNDLRQNNRKHQAQELLRQLIQGSCTPALGDRLDNRSANYILDVAVQVQGQPAQPPDMVVSGTCMLFELISLISVQTRATVATLCNRLDNLPGLMLKHKSNIRSFHTEIESICTALRARRHTPPELRSKLFEGYAACDDAQFREYIKRKQESYEDGTIAQLDDAQLMSLALERYKILHDDKKVWMEKSEDQLEILAMKAEINRLRQNPPTKKQAKEKVPAEKKNADAKWAWKLVAPKSGEPHEKAFEGKDYIYCPHHQTTKWVLKINRKGKVHSENCEARNDAGSSAAGSGREQALASVLEDPDASGEVDGSETSEGI